MNPEAYLEMDEVESKHWWFTGRRCIISSIISAMQLPKKSRILEVGCGTGGNLKMLSKFGELSSFERNSEALKMAISKTNNQYSILSGWCPDNIPFQNQQFDLICVFDVLEHIDEDIQTLVNLKSLLAKDGQILITVPAYKWLFGPHDKFLHHKRRYSSRELRKKSEAAGLTPIKISYFNTLLFPIAILVRLLDRIWGSTNGVGTKVPNPFLGACLHNIFTIEKHLLKYCNIPFGVSLMSILKK